MNVLSCWTRCSVHILQRRVVRRGLSFLAFLIVALILLQYHSLDGWTAADYWTSVHTDTLDAHSISPGERKLAIILPADNPSPDLCKVISSAVALGYPAPIIVNWRKDFHTDADGIGPSQLGKISGTLNFLEWAMSAKAPQSERLTDDDLVLMLDAYDIWLQLPPRVLLNRFFTSNERADRRIAREYGEASVSRGLMQQTVVVSAQKGCMAPRDSISNLHCNSVPESTLPTNVYGLLTDSLLSRILRWKYTRPKYINSGSFMGPAGDVRRYFRRVKDRMDEDFRAMDQGQELGGDQGVFAEIFGEQESWRRRTQKMNMGGAEAETKLRSEFEYHVGLDYTQELFYPTCYSEHDSYFVSLNDVKEVERESRRLGVSPPRVQGVPRDIEVAEKPLSMLNYGGDDDARRGGRGWGDIPLYVDFWTTAIPVAIHHNAWRDGLKSRRRTWWDKTWYFPYLRRLLQARLTETRRPPMATFPALNGSLDVWPYVSVAPDTAAVLFVRNNATMEEWGLESAGWGDVCKSSNATVEAKTPWYDEVFRDGKGPLE